MASPVPTIGPAATLQDASAAMLDAGTHAAVIMHGRRIVGLLTADDIAAAMSSGCDVTASRAADRAEDDVLVTKPDAPLAQAHERMRAAHRRIAAVVDASGQPIGVLVDPEAP